MTSPLLQCPNTTEMSPTKPARPSVVSSAGCCARTGRRRSGSGWRVDARPFPRLPGGRPAASSRSRVGRSAVWYGCGRACGTGEDDAGRLSASAGGQLSGLRCCCPAGAVRTGQAAAGLRTGGQLRRTEATGDGGNAYGVSPGRPEAVWLSADWPDVCKPGHAARPVRTGCPGGNQRRNVRSVTPSASRTSASDAPSASMRSARASPAALPERDDSDGTATG
jgi:hypothetical protein